MSKDAVFLDNLADKQAELIKSLSSPIVNSGANLKKATEQQVKLFQWDQKEIKIDHCSISGVALQIDRTGNWTLNLRADQNRKPEGLGAASFNPKLYIKRNKFSVRIRCYGDPSDGSDFGQNISKPLIAEFEIPEFWVENGKPHFLTRSGSNLLSEDKFNLAKRVELEFSYLK